MGDAVGFSYRGHKIHPAALSGLDQKGRLQKKNGYRIYDSTGKRITDKESLAEALREIDRVVEAEKESG